jgi:aminoacylase
MSSGTDVDPSVKAFQEFLRIRSVAGEGASGAYQEATDWLCAKGKEIGLNVETKEFVANKPVIIMQIDGEDNSLPAIILNSHYDVVPADASKWDDDPFSGKRLDNGNIYGRGAQDMKCVCVQYLEALRAPLAKAKAEGRPPFKRRLILTYVPDEEIGGADGMGKLVVSEMFQALQPIGLVLDEGLANTTDNFTVFYGERSPWWIMVKATGPTGHGSRFIANTAVEKLIGMANKALEFRSVEEKKLGYICKGCSHAQAKKLGDVTTVNLTMLEVVPSSLTSLTLS